MKILGFKWSQKQDLRGYIFSEKRSVCYVSMMQLHIKFQLVVCSVDVSLSCENMYRIDIVYLQIEGVYIGTVHEDNVRIYIYI